MTAYSLNSMTAFARSSGHTTEGGAWLWELRSVNGKGLDIRFRMPSGFEGLEAQAKSRVAAILSRGNVTANLSVEQQGDSEGYLINAALLQDLVASAKAAGEDNPRIDTLLTVRGVVESRDAAPDVSDKTAQEVMAGLEQALTSLCDMRAKEGAGIADALADQMSQMEALAEKSALHAATQPEAIKARLHQQVQDLLDGEPPVAEERLAHEVALLVAKADIREEVDRLKAHLTQAKDLMQAGKPCGRRLDFLAQELNREANTLCSKSHDMELTRVGLELKAVIEQWREQIQNIE